MSDKSWWAKQMGATAPPPPPPVAPHAPSYPANYQQAPPQVPQQMPQQAQPQVTIDNIAQMAEYWQGGEATRTETQRCPKCGGNHFFSRSQGAHRGPAPAPMCADCGFNGLFDQGDPSTWGTV